MKKKIFGFVFAFALLLTTTFCLTACGDKNYYYTISAPKHCNIDVVSYATDTDGKNYINKGEQFSAHFYIEEGWSVADELTIKVNDTAVEWTSVEGTTYTYTFTPDKDFNIIIEGQITEKYCQVNFVKDEGLTTDDFDGLYIRFAGGLEQNLNAFLNNTTLSTKLIKYNNDIEFWVYTKGYTVKPYLFPQGLEETFYKNEANNEYGYHYFGSIIYDTNYIFSGTLPKSYSFKIGASRWFTGEINKDQADAKLKLYVDYDLSKLTIELREDTPDNVLSALKLKINNEEQNITLNKGVNEIALKIPYEYDNASNPYDYDIDLNFYEIEYFNGCVDDILNI